MCLNQVTGCGPSSVVGRAGPGWAPAAQGPLLREDGAFVQLLSTEGESRRTSSRSHQNTGSLYYPSHVVRKGTEAPGL